MTCAAGYARQDTISKAKRTACDKLDEGDNASLILEFHRYDEVAKYYDTLIPGQGKDNMTISFAKTMLM